MTMNAFNIGPIQRNVRNLLAPAPQVATPGPYAAPLAMEAALPALSGAAASGELSAVATATDQDNRQLAAGHVDSAPPRPLGGWVKRVVDLAVSLTALALAAPIMLVIALVLKATLRGPVIFSHGRVGFNGRMFKCYKFRSMVTDSQRVLEEHLAHNPDAAREWQATQKLRRDPRITVFGQMLRKSSLDELPQLFNIVLGDMSCVGPRPVVADELQRYGIFAADYLRTRPGLTGLWQVNGRSNTDYSRRVFLDSQYVRTWSLGGDIAILVRTVFAVMRFDQTS
jgi:exopolysaccharide production protein ExoY